MGAPSKGVPVPPDNITVEDFPCYREGDPLRKGKSFLCRTSHQVGKGEKKLKGVG